MREEGIGSAASPAAWQREAISAAEYDRIAEALASTESPVGIDAKHTHVLILHALDRIEKRLARLEQHLRGDAADQSQSDAGRVPG